MLITTTLLATCFCLLFAYLWKLKSRYEYFVRRNIPGPPFEYIFGHYRTLWRTSSYQRQIQEWTRQYGSIYGLFEGSRPMYIVSNANFLEEVYIKQFSSFHSRRGTILDRIRSNSAASLFSAHANQWRRQRHIINPTFTTLKLKTMTSLMNKCIESFMLKVSEMNGSEFNIYEMYKRLTMDVIWHCAFGIDTDMQNDVENPYMKNSIALFQIDITRLPIVKLSNIFPWLNPFLVFMLRNAINLIDTLRRVMPSLMRRVQISPITWIMEQVREVVKKRVASCKGRVDLLQLMLDAAKQDEVKDHETDELMSKHLQYSEVVSNIILFMLAGFETTSNFLAYSTYVLAKHPDIQEKLRAEIDEQWQEYQELDYERVSDMTYMDLFIREVLRMYRVSGQSSTRQCNRATTVCGHQIEAGSVIQADVYTIHYDPELWGPEDPNLFIPERHSVKRHPAANFAFGIGPRNCVGKRFALMELKMCLARLLRTYNVLPGDKLEQGMARRETPIIAPQAIYVRLERRSD